MYPVHGQLGYLYFGRLLSLRLLGSNFIIGHHQYRFRGGSPDSSAEDHLGLAFVEVEEDRGVLGFLRGSLVCTLTPIYILREFDITNNSRAVASAIIRLACVVAYRRSQDMAYNMSVVELASLAELACSFLVLCIPSTPKALASIASLPLFGSRVSSSKRSSGTKGSAWPRPRRYEQVDERALIPLARIRNGSDGPYHRNELKIMYGTETTVTSEYSQDARNCEYHKQHPWVLNAP